ncbi:hypothetical protein DRN93_01155 [archaeon]|nr:MAG: hypothetical protein DRN93_01155 [archaeon]
MRGSLRGLLPLIDNSSLDCVESLTLMPGGNVPLEDFRRMAGERLTLWSRLLGICFTRLYSKNCLRNLVYEIFSTYGEGGLLWVLLVLSLQIPTSIPLDV